MKQDGRKNDDLIRAEIALLRQSMETLFRQNKVEIDSFKKQNEIDLKGIHSRLDISNGNVAKNTQFRYETNAQFRTWKFIAGFLGFSSIIQLIYLFFTHQG